MFILRQLWFAINTIFEKNSLICISWIFSKCPGRLVWIFFIGILNMLKVTARRNIKRTCALCNEERHEVNKQEFSEVRCNLTLTIGGGPIFMHNDPIFMCNGPIFMHKGHIFMHNGLHSCITTVTRYSLVFQLATSVD